MTYTFTGERTGQNTYTVTCSDGTASETVTFTYGTTSQISFSVGNIITIKLKSSTNQLAYDAQGNDVLVVQGTATLTLKQNNTYIYRVRLFDTANHVIEFGDNGNQVTSNGTSQGDYWNCDKTFEHVFPNGLGIKKIEVRSESSLNLYDDATVISDIPDQCVTGSEIRPAFSVTWHGVPLSQGTHYTVQFSKNVAPGTATVSVNGMGAFENSKTKDFTIRNYAPTDFTSLGDNTYAINNRDDLDHLALMVTYGNNCSGLTFQQRGNISYTPSDNWNKTNSTENNFTRIGTANNQFLGTYDGGGYTISGIRIYKGSNESTDSYQGLFGSVGSGGKVKRLNLADARITGYHYTGGIAGYTFKGTIEDCTVASNVCIHAVVNSNQHGGIVGYNNQGTVQRCVSAATVTAAASATGCTRFGGIVGIASGGTVQNCLALGARVDVVSSYYGAISSNTVGTLQNNYYSACTIGSATTDIGIGSESSGPSDYTNNNGAVPALRENASNTTAIGLLAAVPANFGTYSVSLDGRTLQAGGWNTFCAPFSAAIPSGWTVKKLTGSALSAGALTLNFDDAGSIEAGKPYLVKVDDTVTNPTFSGVRVVSSTTTTETTYADFVPVTSPKDLTGGDKSVLFVSGGNTLTYPSADGKINAFRAYFQLHDAGSGVKAFNMNFEDNATSIRSIDNGQLIIDNEDEAIYNLAGQRLQKMQKGFNIVNGKKVIIK